MRHRSTRLSIYLLLALVSAPACTSVLGPDEVRIRVRNASVVNFESTIINFSRQNEQYGAVEAGRTTDYREIGQAYSYAYVEVLAGGNRYVMQPIDYVGEEQLKAGSYTYELSFNGNSLVQRLVRD
ncbi:MAG: hypothetical protein ACREMA_07750 [Longimicrobiales bacterium]